MNDSLLHHHHNSHFEAFIITAVIIVILLYIGAAVYSSNCRQLREWQWYRCFCFLLGVLCAVSTFTGPLAQRAHTDFTAHMISHLLLGMLSPLLIAFSAPLTLLLRSINVKAARYVVKILSSRPLRIITHPIIAAALNIGGLWILYTTNLYGAMQQSMLLHWLVHFHIFAAGYLFTVSLIYIDIAPHRYSFLYRSIVFVIALAGHSILAKYIYAFPPLGVVKAEAQIGGMLMYYGGDVIDIVIVFILCLQWYRTARPRPAYSPPYSK